MKQQLFTLPDHPLVVIVWYLAFFVKLCRSLLAILSLLYVDHGIVFPSFIGVFWSLLWYIQPFIYIRGGSVSIISVVFNSVLFQLTVLINLTGHVIFKLYMFFVSQLTMSDAIVMIKRDFLSTEAKHYRITP